MKNLALTMIENYDPNNGPFWDAGEVLERAEEEIKRLLKIEAQMDVLACHMAEVKAISDGGTENKIGGVVEHCLQELKRLG